MSLLQKEYFLREESLEMFDTLKNILLFYNYFILYYFLTIGSIYLLLSIISFFNLRKYTNRYVYKDYKNIFRLKKYKSISLIVPAHNEEVGIVAAVQALLQLEYPDYQIVVVNDGSKDNTLNILKENFKAVEIPYLPLHNLSTQKVNSVFICKGLRKLLIVDKQNGGKADAINAGINLADSDLIIVVDADSIVERDALLKISNPFTEDENIVAVGGTIRVANGCEINKGFVSKIGLPISWLAKFQVVEYLRAFMFGRNGLDVVDGILIISGAFSCFKKDEVIKIGGFLKDCIGEDMEIIVRMHEILRKENPYLKISFAPDSICWTEAPEKLKTLKLQRKRWQKGTILSLLLHKKLLFNTKYGLLGMVVYPYFFLFEMIGPSIEVLGYAVFILSIILGIVSFNFVFVLLAAAIFFGVVLSLLAVIFEELTLTRYLDIDQLLELFVLAVLENFGYRQLTSWYRFVGTIEYIMGDRKWGKMERKRT
ncbi:MAG: glycosyltransferase [Actinobacteria bacterium]|nr:glycosyltransferase [Actinomycetota bacterium]